MSLIQKEQGYEARVRENLKILCEYLGVQKQVANKIGVSESTLSRMINGQVPLSFYHLDELVKAYNLDPVKFMTMTITPFDIDMPSNGKEGTLLGQMYYFYFLPTNVIHNNQIHKGIMKISTNNISFDVILKDYEKNFEGHLKVTDSFIDFHLRSSNAAQFHYGYGQLLRPKTGTKYIGGMGLMLLPADFASRPSAQKIIVSSIMLDVKDEYIKKKVTKLLSCRLDASKSGIKVSEADNDEVLQFLLRVTQRAV